ncbi:MAG: phosphoglycerate kinase [Promethearchaeota archaeon]
MEIKFKSIEDFNLKGKKVILRVDINSSIDIEKNEIREDPRIKAILPTLEMLKDSAVVLIAHQSRPGKDQFTSLKLHAERLNEYLNGRVKFVEDIFGETAIEAIKALKPGEVLVLNNVRMWDPENKNGTIEEAEQTELIKTLAPLFDYFINDAFGAAHRSQSSLVGWPTLICGPLVTKELRMVERLLNPERPSVMLVGGAKAVSKFKALKYNLENNKVDKVLIAGVTGLMMQVTEGLKFAEADEKFVAGDIEKVGGKEVILDVINRFGDKIVFPIDYAVEKGGKREEYLQADLAATGLTQGDIGTKTQEKFREIIMNAKTVVANGPPGIFENEKIFAQGSYAMVKAMGEATEKGAFTVIGGGEMGTAAEMSGLSDKISQISTGGGALLEIISGKKVPLLKALESKPPK